MWPFKSKPAWDEQYALNIYDGLVAHNDVGDITALSLRIPTAQHRAFQDKMLLTRELLCFVALAQNGSGTMQPVMRAFADIVVKKCGERGLQMNVDQLANYAFDDTEKLIEAPIDWAKSWMAEFQADKDWNAVRFADHCLKLRHAYETSISNTRP